MIIGSYVYKRSKINSFGSILNAKKMSKTVWDVYISILTKNQSSIKNFLY